jgi:AmmeMemoRadiSam system protein B
MTVREDKISMCGLTPTTSTLVAAKELGGKGVEIISYRTSGHVTKDYETVVGYAGILIHEERRR